MPDDLTRVAHQTQPCTAQFVTFEEPAISLDLFIALKLGVFYPQDGSQEVQNVLCDSHISFDNALLGDLLVLDVHLEQNCTDELSLRGLLRSAHQVKERIEQ